MRLRIVQFQVTSDADLIALCEEGSIWIRPVDINNAEGLETSLNGWACLSDGIVMKDHPRNHNPIPEWASSNSPFNPNEEG